MTRRVLPGEGARLRSGIIFTLLFNGLFAAFLAVRPGGHPVLLRGDHGVEVVGPLLAAALCFLQMRTPGEEASAAAKTRRWVPMLLGAALVVATLPAVFLGYEEVVRGQGVPAASSTDLDYLIASLVALLAVQMLPGRPFSTVSGPRSFLDGTLVVTAVAAFGWYFVLGPSVLHQTTANKVAAVVAFLGQLVLVACALLAATRIRNGALRVCALLLSLGLGLLAITDVFFEYQRLHGSYATGSLLDLGWPLGAMLAALGTIALGPALDAWEDQQRSPKGERVLEELSPLWSRLASIERPVLPYALLVAVLALAAYSTVAQTNPDLQLGARIFAGFLLTLLLGRQGLVILENTRLYGRLSHVYRQMVADAERLEQLQGELQKSEGRYRSLAETSPDGVLLTDLNHTILMCNQRAAELFKYESPDHMAGLSLFDRMAPSEREFAEENRRKTLATGSTRDVEHTLVRPDGTTFPATVSTSVLTDDGGMPTSFISVVRDITDRKEAEQALEYQTLHDPLTDLPNRTLLHDRLRQAVLAAHRTYSQVALLVMDLDRFKEVNDTLGHSCGDMLLQQIGPRLRSQLRESDTVARLGGDEFGVLLPQTDTDGAVLVAEKILKALRQPFQLDTHTLDVATSIGIVVYPQHGMDDTTLLQRADVAMYVAKRASSGYAVYSMDQDDNNRDRLTLAMELRDAIEGDQLLLHYQPKVNARTRYVESVEALVRWQHPTRGLMQPGQFITLAEHTGLIRSLSLWVLRAVVQQQRTFRDLGLKMRIAVNLSSYNLQDRQLSYTIAGLLESSDLALDWLEVEITENAVMRNPEGAEHLLTRLHDMGIRIAVDDFGTGYSSLSHLKELPIDEIKVDRSFVLDMLTNDEDARIVRSIVDLGHNLGLDVVAEGVEDAATAEALASMGCDIMQGYYLCRPLPADELIKRLTERVA